MKLRIICVAAAVTLAMGTTALGQCCLGHAKSSDTAAKPTAGVVRTAADDQSAGGKASCSAAGKEQCGQQAALAGMPLMECHVGDKVVNCPLQAEQLAKGNDAKITYVVAGREYTAKNEALEAYAKQLEDHLSKLTAVRYAVGEKCVNCPMAAQALAKDSGAKVKYQLASFTFASQDEADKAAGLARAAADKVTMKLLVDGKEVACNAKTCSATTDNAAAAHTCAKAAQVADAGGEIKSQGTCEHANGAATAAKGSCHAAGETVTAAAHRQYVIGDFKTGCATMARVYLAAEKIMAAQKAVQEYVAAQEHDAKVAQGN